MRVVQARALPQLAATKQMQLELFAHGTRQLQDADRTAAGRRSRQVWDHPRDARLHRPTSSRYTPNNVSLTACAEYWLKCSPAVRSGSCAAHANARPMS